MKINSLSPKTTFKQFIPVKSITNPEHDTKAYKNRNVDDCTKEIVNILNRKKSKFYTDKEEYKIREFFGKNISDYNPKYGKTLIRKVNGKLFLVTGKDAKSLLNYEKLMYEKREDIRNSEERDAMKQILITNTFIGLGHYILENASDFIDDSRCIEFNSSKLNRDKLTFEQTFGEAPIRTKLNNFVVRICDNIKSELRL